MSAIYGLVHFDGAPVAPEQSDAMKAAIAYWGQDGGGVATGEGAALGTLVSHTTPEAVFETGPVRTPNGVLVAAIGRLDNRDELAGALGMRPGDRNVTSDGAIISAAYGKWGEAAPARLYGDWSFAAWDAKARRLFLARDQLGNTALYYHATARNLAFASSRKALFALAHVPRRLNELALAQHLTMWITDGAATLHENIYHLPPGHTLTAGAGGVAVQAYWNPETLPDLRLESDEAYVEAFIALYAAAVRTRLRTRGNIAITLSSGLDSGSVTALAAREPRTSGSRLIALTSSPLFPEIADAMPNARVDEAPMARTVAQACGGLEHLVMRGERITPLTAVRRSLSLHDQPEYAVANLPWILDILDECGRRDARVLLTGQLGNAGVSWSGDRHLVPRLLGQGRFVPGLRALRRWQKAERISWPRAVWHQVVKPLRTAAQLYAFRRGWRERPAGIPMINPAFEARMRVGQRMRESGYDPAIPPLLEPRAQRMRILAAGSAGVLWHATGAGSGLDVRDPTADVRLLEFCLGIPDEQFSHGGWDRSLMRRAMTGLLPEDVRCNRVRGVQGADFGLRLRADAANVDAAVGDIAQCALAREYLDVPMLQSRWKSLRADPLALGGPELNTFGRSLQFGVFLGQGL